MTVRGSGPLLRLASRAYAVALKAFPRRFRDAGYTREMQAAFREALAARHEARGAAAASGFVVRALGDALATGVRERLRGGGRHTHAHDGERTGGSGTMWLAEIRADVTFAFRSLRRAPAFTAGAVLVLALGIGANAAVFTALRETLLRPPPFPEPDRLVLLDLTQREPAAAGRDGDVPGDLPGARPFPWSYPKFQVLLATPGRLVDPVAGFATRTATLLDGGSPARITVEVVSPQYFEVLGVSMEAGRAFLPEEGDPDTPRDVVVLGHALWRARFGGDPRVVGRAVALGGRSLTVVGVAPASFLGLSGRGEAWIPMGAAAAEIFSPWMVRGAQAHWFQVVGRLRAGASLADARAQVAAIGDEVARVHPDEGSTQVYGADVRSLAAARANPRARTSVLVLAAAAGLVLLIACANLAGLLLARLGARRRDSAVRLAIGAGRWRVARGHMVEALLLALAGGATGLVVARAGLAFLGRLWPDALLYNPGRSIRVMDLEALRVDGGVAAFTLVVSLGAGLLFGALPSLRLARSDLAGALREGAGSTSRGRGGAAGLDGRKVLVGGEIALALVLLVGAGLMLGSLARLQAVERGFDPRGVVTFSYALDRGSTAAADPAVFHEAFLERAKALPGVVGATVGCVPLGGHCWITRVRQVDGGPMIPDAERPEIGVDAVGDDHFSTLGVPLLRGRTFGPADGATLPAVLIINESAARRLFPGEDPLGRRLGLGIGSTPEGETAVIVGVVGDVLYRRPDRGVMPEAYVPLRQESGAAATVLVRAAGEPLDLVPLLRRELNSMEPTLAMFQVRTLEELNALATADTRAVMSLLLLFAGLATLLAATGIWSVVAYSVAQRRREIGLRIVLGARPEQVLGLVVRQGVAPAAVGALAGVAGTLAANRVLESLLFGVSATDPVTIAAGASLLLGVTALASWLPALRATRLEPMRALRED